MSLLTAALLMGLGLALILLSAERLLRGVVGSARTLGLSAFLLSVVFIGFDPENLAVGVAGTAEGASGIALGSIVGAAMVAVALAFGVTALLAPMRFQRAPLRIVALPAVSVAALWLLAMDGSLSRFDGTALLLGYAAAVACVAWLSRRGIDVRAGGGVAEVLEEAVDVGRWRALATFVVSLAVLVLGSELLVQGAQDFVERFEITDTVFGMSVLALAVSVEEIARELPAARAGRPEISFGNVVGSVFAFFLLNAGVIALVRPVAVDDETRRFYLPLALAAVLIVSALVRLGTVSRLAGVVLVALYVGFFIGGYV